MPATYQRFATGDLCQEGGRYEFDGYVQRVPGLLPAVHEIEVDLLSGDVFPYVRSTSRPCYWRLVDGVAWHESDDAQWATGST